MSSKRYMKVSVGLLVILLGLLITTAQAQTIRMAYIESPPYYFTNEAMKPEGILIDIVEKVMARAGYRWTAVSYPVKRMTRLLVHGDIDLWVGLATLSEFEGHTLVGESDVATVTMRAYTAGEKTPILKKEDLTGQSVIILRGYSYGGWAKYIKNPSNWVTYHEPLTHRSAFQMLKARRADYLLNYETPAERTLKEMKFPDIRFNNISSLKLKFVISQKTPDARNVLRKLEEAYQQLKAEGQFQTP